MNFPTHIIAVGGIVENTRGEVLLVKLYNNQWVFPGGQVEVGENLTDALIREIKEESGIDVCVQQLIGVYSNTGMYKWYDGVTDVPTKLMLDFTCKYISGQPTISDETSEVKWVLKEDALNYITAPAIETRYRAYLNQENGVNYMEYITKPTFDVKHNVKIV